MSDKFRQRMIMIGGWTRLYRKAKDSGFEITLVQEMSQIKPEDLTLVDEVITLPLDDPTIPDILTILHQRQPYNCVVSLQEFGLMTAAIIKERLGISGNPVYPVMITRDKEKMREHLLQSGLRSIPYSVVSTVHETCNFANQHGWPIILKPVDGTGSMQIHKVETEEQIEEALNSIRQAFPNSRILAEKYVVGSEISVEAVTVNGQHTVVAVTDKLTTGAPYFVEIGHSIPSALPEDSIIEIKKVTIDFLNSIGHYIGPSHTEMIVTEDGPYIIESHTRAGGDFIYDLVELAYGVDLFKLTFEGLAGHTSNIKVSNPTGAAIRYFTLQEGRIVTIEGLEQVKQIDGIIRFDINLKPGQVIRPFTNSKERYGCIIAQGETVQDALTKISTACDKIKIEME